MGKRQGTEASILEANAKFAADSFARLDCDLMFAEEISEWGYIRLTNLPGAEDRILWLRATEEYSWVLISNRDQNELKEKLEAIYQARKAVKEAK